MKMSIISHNGTGDGETPEGKSNYLFNPSDPFGIYVNHALFHLDFQMYRNSTFCHDILVH